MASVFSYAAFWIFIIGLIILIIGLILFATTVQDVWKWGVTIAGIVIIVLALIIFLVEYSYSETPVVEETPAKETKKVIVTGEVVHPPPIPTVVTSTPTIVTGSSIPSPAYHAAPPPIIYHPAGYAGALPPTLVTGSANVMTSHGAEHIVGGMLTNPTTGATIAGATISPAAGPTVLPSTGMAHYYHDGRDALVRAYNTGANVISGAYTGGQKLYSGAQHLYAGGQQVYTDASAGLSRVSGDAAAAYHVVRPAGAVVTTA